MSKNIARTERIHERLLEWYATEARELPWRRTRDPYAILVSEIMLQQTRVETAIAYFERFMAQFPSIEALAEASIDEVLKVWQGLGYYRRAHNLHAAARRTVEEHGGSLPDDVKQLRSLPGIGAYTAGAVASIAFGRNQPALDGNIIRVLTRVYRIQGDPSRAATRAQILQHAQALTRLGSASEINQALMDLGARICRPRTPDCGACPITNECDAHHAGEETAYPRNPKRQPVPHRTVVAGVVWEGEPYAKGARVLVAKRRTGDMLGGLWEFPGGCVESGETPEEALHRELREELAIEVNSLTPLVTVRHTYTHFRMTMHVYSCRHCAGEPVAIECDDLAWTTLQRLDEYAFSKADLKVIEALTDPSRRSEIAGRRPGAASPADR